ncbi:MAG: septation protein SpoVG family protein, partial [bacterium]
VIHDIRLVKTGGDVTAVMPTKEHQGGYREVVHPITQTCRQKILKACVQAYNEDPETEQELSV